MNISLEISYYPLCDDHAAAIDAFLQQLAGTELHTETGGMSTVVVGEYDAVMSALNGAIKESMQQYPSVFSLKLSNACPV